MALHQPSNDLVVHDLHRHIILILASPTTPCAEYCGHCVGLWFHHEGKTCAEFEDYKRRGEDDIKSRLLIEGT